jgi:hypothetical protein
MAVRARSLVFVATLLLGLFASAPGVRAGTQGEITDCSVEVQTPSVPVGAEARYVVHLFGGNGSYSISFAYGDGWADSASVTGTQATFAHWLQTTGTFTQTASVISAGSSAMCSGQTVVW